MFERFWRNSLFTSFSSWKKNWKEAYIAGHFGSCNCSRSDAYVRAHPFSQNFSSIPEIRESNHGLDVCKEHYAQYYVPFC